MFLFPGDRCVIKSRNEQLCSKAKLALSFASQKKKQWKDKGSNADINTGIINL